MQIFVSWSGKPAQALASFLQTWLQRVIQELEPFMSTNSIAKGARWSPEIAKRLEETSEAIVCVTTENQDAPWLNFEAGALAKATGSRVRPLLIDLSPSDLDNPLSEFQLTSATDKEDVRRMVESINENCNRSLSSDILDATFEREWPALEAKVKEVIKLIGVGPDTKRRKRDDPELLDEILDRVRAMERLTQVHIDMSDRIYAEMTTGSGRRVGSTDLRRKIAMAGSNIERFYTFLSENTGRPLRIGVQNGKALDGEIVGFKDDMPDTAVILEYKGKRSTIPIASIESVQYIDAEGNPS